MLILQAPTNQFGDQCPPFVTDPADTDVNALPNCIAGCTNLCPGGIGRICGEVYMGPIFGSFSSFAKICTCYCPPQACVVPTPAPTPTKAIALVPVLVPNIKKLTLIKIILKFSKFLILLLKFCALYWLKVLLFGLYFCLSNSCFPWKLSGRWGWKMRKSQLRPVSY